MRKISIILIISMLAAVAGGLFYFVKAQQSNSLTILVNGEKIVLKSGVNVSSEIFEAARVPEFVSTNDWQFADGKWDVMPAGDAIPLELRQIILLEDHPGLPSGHEWIVKGGWEISNFSALSGETVQGIITTSEGRSFTFSLVLPQNWSGKVETQVQGATVFFNYTGDPILQHPLFYITALTEAAWQKAQGEVGQGIGLISVDSVIFAYNPALDNPFTGIQADEFQNMAAQIGDILGTLVAVPAP